MTWMGHNRFEIDDHVATTKVFMSGAMTFPPGSIGIVTATGEGGNFEVKFSLGDGNHRLVTLHESMLRLFDGPESEPTDAPARAGGEGGFTEGALDHLADSLNDQDHPTHRTRQIMVADVYARLEVAAAIDRLAKAVASRG